MVDADRLITILGRVTSRLGHLQDYAAQDPVALQTDRVRMGDLKYTFQTALEACLDAAQHVVADQGLGTPASNADAFRLLAAAGLIPADLGTAMAGAVGFRNVLVHDYAEVDDHRVVENLSRLTDLRAFVQAMTRLVNLAE